MSCALHGALIRVVKLTSVVIINVGEAQVVLGLAFLNLHQQMKKNCEWKKSIDGTSRLGRGDKSGKCWVLFRKKVWLVVHIKIKKNEAKGEKKKTRRGEYSVQVWFGGEREERKSKENWWLILVLVRKRPKKGG